MPSKLCQMVAKTNGVKKRSKERWTQIYQDLGKNEHFYGLTKTYEPKDEKGEREPPVQKLIVKNAKKMIEGVITEVTELFDVTLTLDVANTKATAAVMIDGVAITQELPATYLLFLEAQVINLRTFISKLPVLDVTSHWEWDPALNSYVTAPKVTASKTQETEMRVVVPATDKHPAQTEKFTKNVIVGTWTAIDLSSALPAVEKQEMADRVEKLLQAVIAARHEANASEVTDQKCAEKMLNYVFGK